jgi:hypothetical protein
MSYKFEWSGENWTVWVKYSFKWASPVPKYENRYRLSWLNFALSAGIWTIVEFEFIPCHSYSHIMVYILFMVLVRSYSRPRNWTIKSSFALKTINCVNFASFVISHYFFLGCGFSYEFTIWNYYYRFIIYEKLDCFMIRTRVNRRISSM